MNEKQIWVIVYSKNSRIVNILAKSYREAVKIAKEEQFPEERLDRVYRDFKGKRE